VRLSLINYLLHNCWRRHDDTPCFCFQSSITLSATLLRKSNTINSFDSAYLGSLFSGISKRFLYKDKITATISKFYTSSVFLHSGPGETGLGDVISCIRTIKLFFGLLASFPSAFQKFLYSKKYKEIKQSCLTSSALVGKKYLWELNFVTLTFARKSTMMWRNELEA
jgi:hypothetical protein